MATSSVTFCFILAVCIPTGLSQTTKAPCKDDSRINCWSYEDSKCLGIYAPWSRRHCPFRCGYCEVLPPCEDEINNCDEYADDMCTSPMFGGFSREQCRKHCDKCRYPARENMTTPAQTTDQPVTSKPTTVTSQAQTQFPVLPTGEACKDSLSDCGDYSDEACVGVFKVWAMQTCPRRCGYCTNQVNYCADYEDCGKLPKDLCTNANYKTLAQTSCRKFCGLCNGGTVTGPTKMPVPTKNPNQTDRPPVARAPDVVINYPDTTAFLNATESTDDKGITDFRWEYKGNLTVEIRGEFTDTLFLNRLEAGTYNFKLTVTDTAGQKTSIIVKLFVVRANNTCELPVDEGLGKAYFPRYFYNSTSMTCMSFIYGGIPGNSNNFETEQQCLDYCLGKNSTQNAMETTNPTPASTTAAPQACSKNFDIQVPDCCGPICACNDTVQGYVTDASHNATPMANVSVYVSNCYCHAFAFTDDQGYYSLRGICLTGGTLRFESPGYRSHLETPGQSGVGQFTANAPMEPDNKDVTIGNPAGTGSPGATKTMPSFKEVLG